VGLVIAAPLTKWYGSSALTAHKFVGYSLMTLVLWRFLWGFWGSKSAKFSTFFPTPTKVIMALSGKMGATLSHNPLGSLMIFALLGMIALQSFFGLFATDDITVDGPFYHLMPQWGALATKLHHIGFKLLWILAVMHICANLFYTFFKKQPLIQTMITGKAPAQDYVDLQENSSHSNFLAIALLVLSAIAVFGSLYFFGKSPFS
jgi:cytochrome b